VNLAVDQLMSQVVILLFQSEIHLRQPLVFMLSTSPQEQNIRHCHHLFLTTPQEQNIHTIITIVITIISFILLLLVCVSLTIIGQPRNSVLIRRV